MLRPRGMKTHLFAAGGVALCLLAAACGSVRADSAGLARAGKGGSSALSSGHSPVTEAAQASPAPGWRIVKVYGASAGYPVLEGLGATSRSDAWVSGTTAAGTHGLFIERWNGSTWQQLAVPRGFRRDVTDGVIGAASLRDMWTFPIVNNGSTAEQYALHLNDGKWQSFKLSAYPGLFGTAVFSPSDAWAFGQALTKNPGFGFGAPYAVRYNGNAWRRVSMPGTAVLGVSPLSPSDIWAFGPSAKTAGLTGQDVIGMHWNGRSWSTLAVPRYTLSGQRAGVQSMIALGPDDVWAAESLPAPCGGCAERPPFGTILTHWNGRGWREVIKDTSDAYQGQTVGGQGALAADGSGGLWVEAFNAKSSTQGLLHYGGGRLSRTPEPSLKGFSVYLFRMVLIPRTTSLWAAAELAPARGGGTPSAIFKRGS